LLDLSDSKINKSDRKAPYPLTIQLIGAYKLHVAILTNFRSSEGNPFLVPTES